MAPSAIHLPNPARPSAPIEAVVIGSSTGGPNALAHLLAAIAPDLPAPLVIVQHMPPDFTRHMAERLASLTGLDVREAVHNRPLNEAKVWIAPGDHHLIIRREIGKYRLCIHQEAPENSCRPSVDVLFRSAAAAFGPGTLAVVLTGMGQDGLLGAEAIRMSGGHVVVQDQESSVVWGMPGAIARAGLAHEVLPLDAIGPLIVRRVRRSWGLSSLTVHDAKPIVPNATRSRGSSLQIRAVPDGETKK